MKLELQAYIDKIPQIVSDALPKLEKLGFPLYDIDVDELNMDEFCDCFLGQLIFKNIGQSSRQFLLDLCPDGYFEVPKLPVGESSFIDIGTFTLFNIKYITALTAEYKKQIKQWKKDRGLRFKAEFIEQIKQFRYKGVLH